VRPDAAFDQDAPILNSPQRLKKTWDSHLINSAHVHGQLSIRPIGQYLRSVYLLPFASFPTVVGFFWVFCPLWVISGQTVAGYFPILSAMVQKRTLQPKLFNLVDDKALPHHCSIMAWDE